MNLKNSKFVQTLKRQAEENPVLVLGVAAALLTATAKLMDANTQRSYAKTHAREVDRRIHKTYSA
jgi:hypothetical protein